MPEWLRKQLEGGKNKRLTVNKLYVKARKWNDTAGSLTKCLRENWASF